MPPTHCDPRGRRLTTDSRTRRIVRVGIYERWPTRIETQALRSYIASQPDWRVVLRSSDEGSGGTLKRPGLQRVLTAARSDVIDVLAVGHLHSLSRKTQHLALLLDELTSRGVRIVSADRAIDTETPYGLFLARVVSAVAEIEYTGALADRQARRRPEQESGDEVATCSPAAQRQRQFRQSQLR
jgi:DNA invertase Pin-like site-specific DNA recombinase